VDLYLKFSEIVGGRAPRCAPSPDILDGQGRGETKEGRDGSKMGEG